MAFSEMQDLKLTLEWQAKREELRDSEEPSRMLSIDSSGYSRTYDSGDLSTDDFVFDEQRSVEERVRRVMGCFDETTHVHDVILLLLGIAIRYGEERVKDWDLKVAAEMAREYVDCFDPYVIGGDLLYEP